MSIIEEINYEARKELFDAETYWIYQFKEWWFNLKNKIILLNKYKYGLTKQKL